MTNEIYSQLTLELLVESRKVIPLYFKSGEVWQTDIKLPDLVLRNQSDQRIEVKGLEISGFTPAQKALTYNQNEASINTVIADANKLLNKFLQNPESHWRTYNLHMLFGDVPPTQGLYQESTILQPFTAVCLRLGDLVHFYYAGKEKINRVICEVMLSSGSGPFSLEFPIPLTPYECKGDYIFPVRGNATIVGTAWNRVSGHRMALSQEFALDVVDYRREANGEYTLSSPPNSDKVQDYFIFEREVVAIGDGSVVATGNQWPNKWVQNPLDYSEDRIVELTLKLLEQGMEFNHAILGNYVILDHHNGEYSLYAHMSQFTLTVQVGDSVSQGQVIGKVGNTSNSESPHLHFQLMDSGEFQIGNGLPIMFKNIPDGKPPTYDFSSANSLLYSDYIFVNISD